MNLLFQMVCSSQCYSESCSTFFLCIFSIPFLWRFFSLIQSPPIHFHCPFVHHPTLYLSIYHVEQIFLVFCGRQQLKVLFRCLLHINAARKAALVHLMRWQQFFPQIFPCSYPFPVHLKSIFIAGVSQKVTQVKTKFTLLTFVRSEKDDPLGLMPLNISLFVQLLWGFPKRFFLLGRTLTSKWGFRPNTEAQALAPPHLQFGVIIILPI